MRREFSVCRTLDHSVLPTRSNPHCQHPTRVGPFSSRPDHFLPLQKQIPMSRFPGASSLSKQNHNGSWRHSVFRVLEWQTMLREIVGAWQGRVHDSPPLPCGAFLDLKLQLFPVGIDHYVDIVIALGSAVQAESNAARFAGQIGGGTSPPPGNVFPPEPAAAQRRMRFPERNHAFEETENVLIR